LIVALGDQTGGAPGVTSRDERVSSVRVHFADQQVAIVDAEGLGRAGFCDRIPASSSAEAVTPTINPRIGLG
jgi:hypothetical protein